MEEETKLNMKGLLYSIAIFNFFGMLLAKLTVGSETDIHNFFISGMLFLILGTVFKEYDGK